MPSWGAPWLVDRSRGGRALGGPAVRDDDEVPPAAQPGPWERNPAGGGTGSRRPSAVSFCSTFTVLAALVVVLDEASMLSMTFCPPLFHSGDRPHPTCSTPTYKPPWDMFVSRRYEGVQQRPFKPLGLLDRNICRSHGLAFLQSHVLSMCGDARSRFGWSPTSHLVSIQQGLGGSRATPRARSNSELIRSKWTILDGDGLSLSVSVEASISRPSHVVFF